MRRKIITIDEEKCNGCGNCVTACAEGALAIINGKARLVKEQFCDGFGDCIGECPTGALKIEEREAGEYDEEATRQHVMQTAGPEAVRRMQEAARRHASGMAGAPHGAAEHADPKARHLAAHGNAPGGCPGSRLRFQPRSAAGAAPTPASAAGSGTGHVIASDLEQWPVQIHLVPPNAPFFRNRELVVLSTCAPVASADVHWRFLRGRGVAVGCPKLDDTTGYAEKLGAILSEPTIPKVIVVRMEVPCCGGLTHLVQEAMQRSGRTDLVGEEITVALNGDVLGSRPITATN